MEWVVEENVVCPVTGTAFATVRGAGKLRFIIWYKGNYFLRKGSVISHNLFGITINGKARSVRIVCIFLYSRGLWSTFKGVINCPGNDAPDIRECGQQGKCVFTLCPYGVSGCT